MPRRSPYDIKLSKAERTELLARSRRYTSRYRDVIRAKIVLLASEGMANDAIAARLDSRDKSSASGAGVSISNAWLDSNNSRAEGDRRAFPLVSWSKSSRPLRENGIPYQGSAATEKGYTILRCLKIRAFISSRTNAKTIADAKIPATTPRGNGAMRTPCTAKIGMISISATDNVMTTRLGREDHIRRRSRTA
jgi:hypothetical protein